MPASFAGRSAYLYLRVSTDDQAATGYSLPDQRDLLTRWAHSRGAAVAAEFVDDESAKSGTEIGESFARRPGWRALTAAVAAAPPALGGPDLVVVKDWSRFSRDTTDALVVVHQLRALGVEVQAATQEVDWSSPHALFQVLIPLASAETENRQRSINVKRGMRRAMKEGRFVAKPPYGYVRTRTADGRPSMAPDPETAPHVAAAFEMAGDPALTPAEAYRRMKAAGMRLVRSRFFTMLRDVTYLGRVAVPAWEEAGEAAQEVNGLHEPIVTEVQFARVQARLDRPRRTGHHSAGAHLAAMLPLRGHLRCPECSGLCSGSTPRSRSGKRYAYYICHRCNRQGRGTVFRKRAELVHDAFARHLRRVQLRPGVAALWGEVAARAADGEMRRAEEQARALRQRAEQAEERLAKAEDLYVDGKLSAEAFARLERRCEAERREAEDQLAGVGYDQARHAATVEHVRSGLHVCSRLHAAWERAGRSEEGAEARAGLVGSVWPSGVVFDGEGFGTTPPSPVIQLLEGVGATTNDGPPSESEGRPVGYAREDSNL